MTYFFFFKKVNLIYLFFITFGMTLSSSCCCCFEVCRQTTKEEKEIKAFRTRLKESERHLNVNKKPYQIPNPNRKYDIFQDSDEVLDFWKRKKRLNVYYNPSSFSQASNSFQALGQGCKCNKIFLSYIFFLIKRHKFKYLFFFYCLLMIFTTLFY